MIKHFYIIGPISGCESNNIAEFSRVRDALINAYGRSTIAIIPHDFIASDTPWDVAMRQSISEMLLCALIERGDRLVATPYYDGVVMLDGVEKSEGATLECLIANKLGIPCKHYSEWLALAEKGEKTCKN